MSFEPTPFGGVPSTVHAHVLRLALQQRLGGQHVLDLRGADAMRQRTERAVGRGMAVAADDGGAGQGEALLGPDDVDDALALVVLVVVLDAEVLDVFGQGLDLDARLLLLDPQAAIGGRDVVVDDGECLSRRADFSPGQPQSFECLRAGHLVHEMTVDIEDAGAIGLAVDDVGVENLVVERGRGCFGHGA